MSLPFDSYFEFLQIAKNLKGEDIKNLCKTNKTYYGFCNRNTFWSDLIRINFGIKVPKPGLEIYNYLKNLDEATIQLPDKGKFMGHDLRVYNELEGGLFPKFINSLKNQEMNAIMKGADYKYYNSKNKPNYFFRSYSIYGLAFWYYMYEPRFIIFDFPEYYFKDLRDEDEEPYSTLEDLLDALIFWNFDPYTVANNEGELRYDVRDRIIITN